MGEGREKEQGGNRESEKKEKKLWQELKKCRKIMDSKKMDGIKRVGSSKNN